MANVNRPQGAVPVGTLGAGSWNGRVSAYLTIDATAVHIGDMVKLTGSSGTTQVVNGQDCAGMAIVAKATASDTTMVGAVVGFSPNQDNLNVSGLYKAASTNRIAYVSDDPHTIYEMQEDSAGNNMDADMVGLATDIITGTGSNTTGLSGQMLDSSDTGTALGQMRILGLSKRVDNAIGEYAKWLVMINTGESVFTVGTDV